MARARSKKSEVKAETGAEDIAAIEATLNGEAEVVTVVDDDLEAIAAALEGGEDLVVEIADEDISDVDEDALKAAIAADEAREAAYKDTKSEVVVASEDDVAEAKAKAPKKGSTATKTPTTPADFATAAVALFAGSEIVLDSVTGEIESGVFQSMMEGVTQVKVREKVLNLLKSVLGAGKTAVYTEIAAKLLVEAVVDGDKNVSLADIKAAYVAKGYKPGTVNAQAGQMMVLFPTLKMATKTSPGVLEPNPHSVLLDLIAAAD